MKRISECEEQEDESLSGQTHGISVRRVVSPVVPPGERAAGE